MRRLSELTRQPGMSASCRCQSDDVQMLFVYSTCCCGAPLSSSYRERRRKAALSFTMATPYISDTLFSAALCATVDLNMLTCICQAIDQYTK